MAPDLDTVDRDDALRAMLVDRAAGSDGAARTIHLDIPDRIRVGLVTAVVLLVVVAASAVAIRLGAGRGEVAAGGLPTASTTPAGVVLGSWSSAGGSRQTHTIHPNGLAIAIVFTCTGRGDWSISIARDAEMGGSGPGGLPGCDGVGTSSGNKGVTGSTTVRIRTALSQRWTLTIIGIAETYVTPEPVETVTNGSGSAVRWCGEADLDARFEPYAMPDGVTEVKGGQIVLTNITSSECALAGYPMVRFVDDAGSVLGHHTMNAIDERRSTENGLRAVLLKPGGTAYTQIDYYLPLYYAQGDADGRCVPKAVHRLRIDLANRLAGTAQSGSLEMAIASTTACLNGRWGVDGQYGQLSATVFVDYSHTR